MTSDESPTGLVAAVVLDVRVREAYLRCTGAGTEPPPVPLTLAEVGPTAVRAEPTLSLAG